MGGELVRPCQDCVDPEVVGCQCSEDSSTNILVGGSGSPGDPFVPEIIFDPDSGNQAVDDGTGLLVPTWDYIRIYASVNQDRATTEALNFDANTLGHGNQSMHTTTLPDSHHVDILEDGWYALYAQALATDDTFVTGLNLYWEDGANTKYSEGFADQTPCVVSTYTEDWLSAGDNMSVHIEFTGVGPVTLQGVGGKGYRTFAVVRKIAKV